MSYGQLLLAVALFPIVVIGGYVYSKDKNKEPFHILFQLFIGGIGACILTVIISTIVDLFVPLFAADPSTLGLAELAIYVFIDIALIEEFSKWIMAYKISYNNKEFDEFYDMLLYCMFVALGFACLENILYVFMGGVFTGILRALLAVPGHVCDGLFMGYFLGLAKIGEVNKRTDLKNKYMLLSILVPTAMHGIYDYCLMAGEWVFLIIFFIFVISMYIAAIRKIKKVSTYGGRIPYPDQPLPNQQYPNQQRFCSNCGAPVDNNFCPRCGTKVG